MSIRNSKVINTAGKWAKGILLSPFYALGWSADAILWGFSKDSGQKSLRALSHVSDLFSYYLTNAMYLGYRFSVDCSKSFYLNSGLKTKLLDLRHDARLGVANYIDSSPKIQKTIALYNGAVQTTHNGIAAVKYGLGWPYRICRAGADSVSEKVNKMRARKDNFIASRKDQLDAARLRNTPAGLVSEAAQLMDARLQTLAQDNPHFEYQVFQAAETTKPVAYVFTNLIGGNGGGVHFSIRPNGIEMVSGSQVTKHFLSVGGAIKHIRGQIPVRHIEPSL